MRSIPKHRPSAPLVISLLALFVALGSGAYAVKLKLKPHSVKTKHLKDQAVTTRKLADGAVSTGKIANGAVDASKLAATVRAAVQIGTAGQTLGAVGGIVATKEVGISGTFCVDLSFKPVAGVASVNPTGGQGSKDAQVAVPPDPGTGCPAGWEAEVDVTTNHAYSSGEAPVFVIFF
jgi:hypothetical protein